MTAQTMTTKYDWVCPIYEIRWESEEEKYFHESYNKDFPLIKNLSDWLCDLASTDIDGDGDGVTTVERRSPSNGASISINFLSQPFPE